jgi:hypothetical protein
MGEMALAVHAKIFTSEILEKGQHYISTHPSLNESIIHSYLLQFQPVIMKDVGL